MNRTLLKPPQKAYHKIVSVTLTALILMSIFMSLIVPPTANAIGYTGMGASASKVNVGQKITLSLQGTGSSSYDYKFEVNPPSQAQFSIIQNFSTRNQCDYTPNAPGVYSFRMTVRGADTGNGSPPMLSGTVIVTVYDLSNTSSISHTSVEQGSIVSLNGSASGGSGNYSFKYLYQEPNSSARYYVYGNDFVDSSSVNFKPDKEGSYKLIIIAMDNSTGKTIEKNYNLTVNKKVSKISNTSEISSSSIKEGESVTLKASASGGSGSYSYKYTYKGPDDTEEQFIDGVNYYTEISSKSFKPEKTGTYFVYVIIKDNNDNSIDPVKKTFRLNVSLKDYNQLINNSTISKNEVVIGEDKEVVVTAKASGGSGEYEYRYDILLDNTVIRSEVYSANKTLTLPITASTSSGEYRIKVTIRDTKTNKTTDTLLPLSIKDKQYPEYSVSASIEPAGGTINTQNQTTGVGNCDLKISANASGGKGTYQYAYQYAVGNGAFTYFAGDEYSPTPGGLPDASHSNFTVQFLKPGKYRIRVIAIDERNAEVSKIFTITVNQAPKHSQSDLIQKANIVQTWYDNLTQTQRACFKALTATSSADNFEYKNWEKALKNAKKIGKDGPVTKVDEAYDELEKQDELAKNQPLLASEAAAVLFSISAGLSNGMNWLLKGIGNLLTSNFGQASAGSEFKGFDIQGFVDVYSPIFMVFANSLLVILFGVNIISSTVQYELFTFRGGIRVLAHFFLSKLWIDLSCKICTSVVAIARELLVSVVSKSMSALKDVNFSFQFEYNSGIDVVGMVIDFIVMGLMMILIFLMFIPLLYFLIRVIVKLFIMNFELAGLTAMSPVFFACLVGDATKQYFRNFVATFLSVVVEVIFMGIVYAAFVYWYTTVGDLSDHMNLSEFDVGEQVKNLIIFGTVFIAACRLMIKPPQVFKNLVH